MGQILLVDDEPVLREVLGMLLRKNGYSVIEAETCRDSLAAVADGDVDLVLLDIMLPDGNGIDALRDIKKKSPDTEVIMITAYSSIEGAIEAMREGAFHYIPKPFKNDEVLLTVRRGLEQRLLKSENRALREELDERFGLGNIVGRGEGMRRVFELIRLVAPSRTHVLIEGESGTGKELIARTIHHNSNRSRRPFVVVPSEPVAADVLEARLFGVDREGERSRPGLLDATASGTLFFDEIAEVPRALQARLVEVLERHAYRPLGGAEKRTDLRLMVATSRDLGRLVRQGEFDPDLYDILHEVSIRLPPLRRRREDIPLLVHFFVTRFTPEGQPAVGLSAEAMKILIEAPWPGNVRELENTLARAVPLADDELRLEHLPDSLAGSGSAVRKNEVRRELKSSPTSMALPPAGMSLKEAVGEYERQMIIRALTLSGGVQKRAAELLKVKPTTLNEMIKRLGLSGRR